MDAKGGEESKDEDKFKALPLGNSIAREATLERVRSLLICKTVDVVDQAATAAFLSMQFGRSRWSCSGLERHTQHIYYSVS